MKDERYKCRKQSKTQDKELVQHATITLLQQDIISLTTTCDPVVWWSANCPVHAARTYHIVYVR